MKKTLKIIGIIFLSIFILVSIVILLLSILFPAELVRKEIEKQGTVILGTEVKLEKLKFNVFTGIELNGLSIAQHGKSWEKPEIVTLQSARLKYRLFPLIFKVLSVKECIVEKGVVNLEINKYGSNWDYFLKKLQVSAGSKKIESKKETKTKNESFKNTGLPVELNINRIGIDGLSINFLDSALYEMPARLNVKNLKLIAKNISVIKNTPCDIDGYIGFEFDGANHLNLKAEAKAIGKLKLFDDTTHELSVTGPLNLTLIKGSFLSKDIKTMLMEIMENVIGEKLGSTIKSAMSDPSKITEAADKYFNNISQNSESVINDTLKKSGEILKKKDELNAFSQKTLNDFDKNISSSVNDIDSKINSIDSKINPVIDTVSKIPMIESKLDLNSYRKKVAEIKNRANEKKKQLTQISKENLSKRINDTLSKNIPEEIPDYKTLKKQFDNQVDKYKKDINKELKKYSISDFIKSLLPDLSFMEKDIVISNLSTTINLKKKSNDAQDVKFNTQYFGINGNADLKENNYITFVGDVSANVKEFNLKYMPVDQLKTKIKLDGKIPAVKLTILKYPEFKIDQEKKNEMIASILNNFLSDNYNSNKIISLMQKGISADNIDAEKIKNLISGDKEDSLSNFVKDKQSINNFIDNETDKLINELKNKSTGAGTPSIKLPSKFF
jgi:hypothetical protein